MKKIVGIISVGLFLTMAWAGSHKCGICGVSGIFNGSKSVSGHFFNIYRCHNGHEWIEKQY